MATRVAAAQEGLDEAMKEACAASNEKGVLVASSTMAVSAASDDDAECKQSERSEVQELRGAMRETS